MSTEPLIPQHGGYRNLKSFQLAQLVYDVTVRFCDRYIDKRSRTHDQMVQAARSGVQNIAEGSQASGTSKKMELKLTNVARASLEELRLDYEDFLRQRGYEVWGPNHPALVRFKAKRCSTVNEVRVWVEEERKRGRGTDTDGHGPTQTDTERDTERDTDRDTERDTDRDTERDTDRDTERDTDRDTDKGGAQAGRGGAAPCESVPSSVLVANGALSLLNLTCYLLDRQLAAQAAAFEREGGFTERLYRTRQDRRRGK